MKKICLIVECYKKNIISVAILLVVLIFALLQSVSFLGRVKYMTYTRDFLVGSNLNFNNTIYFMPMIFEGDPRSGIAFEEIKYGNIPGIESVICPKTATVKMTGKYINVLLCDDSFISTFAPIDQGDWFTTPGIKQDDIVACGYLFEDYSLGSQITVDFGWDTPLPFTFTIVGKKNEPSYLPSFGMQSNNVTAMDLFSQGHNTILVQESKEIDAFLEDSNLYHENCMIKLREDITAAERQEVEEFLLSKGSFLYFNTILENTEKEILALQETGISNLKNKKVNQLSGGQKQRVSIARAIVKRPMLILADEPTGALDSKTGIEIMDMLSNLNKEGITIIVVTHDRDIASFCHRQITLADGKVISDITDDE